MFSAMLTVNKQMYSAMLTVNKQMFSAMRGYGSVVRVLDSLSKGHRFKSLQE